MEVNILSSTDSFKKSLNNFHKNSQTRSRSKFYAKKSKSFVFLLWVFKS